MRVGISGAQGVGKTTLLLALKDTGILRDHVWKESGIRDLAKKFGLTLNEHSNDFAQRLIMEHFALTVFLEDNLVSDRTPLDCVTYTRLLWLKQQVSTETYEAVFQMFCKSQPLYDVVFYLRPEFPIESREMRSSSLSFQLEFCTHLYKLVEQTGTELITLTGSVSKRVHDASLTLAAFQRLS